MTKRRVRKYAPLWQEIKNKKVLAVQLVPLSMTEEQAARAAAGFKRAVSKEKYEDIHFKDSNPAATLDFDYNPANRTLTFTLVTPESKSTNALKIL